MGQITLRLDAQKDATLWAAIQAIPAGQRTAQLKRLLEAGLRVGESGVLQRLADLEQRMTAWEQGRTPSPPPISAPVMSAPGPVPTPPGWKESLAQLGAFDDDE